MSDIEWRYLVYVYYGAQLSDDELAKRINEKSPRLTGAGSMSFLVKCASRCKCISTGTCHVERCLTYGPSKTHLVASDGGAFSALDSATYREFSPAVERHVIALSAHGEEITRHGTTKARLLYEHKKNHGHAIFITETLIKYGCLSLRDTFLFHPNNPAAPFSPLVNRYLAQRLRRGNPRMAPIVRQRRGALVGQMGVGEAPMDGVGINRRKERAF